MTFFLTRKNYCDFDNDSYNKISYGSYSEYTCSVSKLVIIINVIRSEFDSVP